jgi:parallel beta-helix repeat protein
MFNRRAFLTWLSLGSIASIAPAIVNAIVAHAKRNSESEDTSSQAAKSTSFQAIKFYVAVNGNDEWSGRLADPNDAKTDGPFATIARSLDEIRQLKRQQNGSLKQSIEVLVRDGTHFLTKTLVFTPEDSGTKNFPITYTAYEDEKPVISGGRRITDWTSTTVNGTKLWVAEIPEVREGKWFFHQLWVNGERRFRARYPNEGYLSVAEVPDITPQTTWRTGQRRFQFRDDDFNDLRSLGNIADAQAVVMSRWLTSHLRIGRVDEREGIFSFNQPSITRIEPGDLYYLENSLEFLDAPGEWYLERQTGRLYYQPMSDEDMNEVEVIAPVLAPLVRLSGRPGEKKFVEYLNFRKLSFAHTQRAPILNGYRVAGIGAPAENPILGDIIGRGVRFCNWQECSISHIGNYAIELANGCHNNRIDRCEIFDLGTGGIKIGSVDPSDSTTYGNEIVDCHIYDGGRIVHVGVGIWIGQSYNNNITRNHIHDFYYTGISVGWTFGYKQSQAKGNIVAFNNVHHIGQLSNGDGPILNELAGIYTLGPQPGTVIRSNTVRQIAARPSEALKGAGSGMGIFLDEGTSNIVVENNLVYQADISFHLHFGRQNIVRNNIFAFGKEYQLSRIREEPHLSAILTRNIIYWSDAQLLIGKWGTPGVKFEQNLYWQVDDGEILFGDLSWDEWQAKGMDKNSLVADPLFVDADEGNFRLESDSPAFQLEFQPIATDQALKSSAKD